MNTHIEADAHSSTREHGFTLVELSIVLVIIGLIVSGVLIGLDMIKNSEVRGTIGQIEKYNSAVNTFRGKYNGLPGDLLATRATAFGLTALAGGDGLGDDDKLLEGSGGTTGTLTTADGEVTLFWQHLSEAGIVDGNYDGSQAASTVGPSYPMLKLRQAGLAAYSSAGIQYFQIGVTASAAGAPVVTQNAITPQEAYNIDLKMDDGSPAGGGVMARAGTVIDTAPSSFTASDCTTAAAGIYQRNLTTVVCQLRLKMN